VRFCFWHSANARSVGRKLREAKEESAAFLDRVFRAGEMIPRASREGMKIDRRMPMSVGPTGRQILFEIASAG